MNCPSHSERPQQTVGPLTVDKRGMPLVPHGEYQRSSGAMGCIRFCAFMGSGSALGR